MKAKLLLFSLVLILFFTGSVIAQGTTVRGVVTSAEDGGPLPGANVIVKNTQKGASTDLDGMYLLEDVSPQDTLVFMYVGYSDVEEIVGNRELINARLTPEAFSADAIVVIGYGTQERKNVTSAISSIGEGAFTQGAGSDAQTLLQARIPGMMITQSNGDLGAESLIRIRGGTSVNASNNPMIVIDGVPIDNESALPNINNKGSDLFISDGTRDNPLGMVNPSDIASVDVLKDASAAAIYGARAGNGVIMITTKEGKAGGSSLTYDSYISTSSLSKELDLMTADEYRAFATESGSAPLLEPANTNWQDEVFRTAVSQNHNLAFSGGTQFSRYRVSFSYLDEEGIVFGSERQRYSLRLNLNHKMLDDKLRLALRINPTYITRSNTPYNQRAGYYGGVFTNILKMNPSFPVKNADGSYFEYTTTSIRNPVALVNEIDDKSESIRVFSNFTAEYYFIPELSGKINVGFDKSSTNRSIYQPTSLPYTAAFGGRADINNNDRQSVLFETTFNYKPDIGESQSLEAWAGYTFQEFENGGFGAASQDYVTDGWRFHNLDGGTVASRPFSFRDENRLVSFLGRVNYGLSGKYMISAALRREGSSRFGEDNKWAMFPSASVGWRLSEESFMQGFSSLSNLKVRLSYGITGNQDIGNYKSLILLGTGGSNAVLGGQQLTGVGQTQIANPDLKWEETSQLNLGIDFSFLENKISGSIDLYQKKTTDLLLEFDVPPPTPVSKVLGNAGEVENKGLEISLNTINMSSGDFFWRSSINFATNSNEVVSLGERDNIPTGDVGGAGLSGVYAQIIIPGQPLGTFWGYKFLGYDAEGNELLTTTGGPKDDGRLILGNAQPDYIWGFTNTINYKGWDFSFFIQAVQGFDLLNNTRLEYQRPSNFLTGINMFAESRDDWREGLGIDKSTTFTDRFIEDGSFIRLQNITLGYTFETDWFRNLRVYVSGDNLFILTDYKGYDPEVNTFTGQAIGVDYTNYPRARTYSFGVNIGI